MKHVVEGPGEPWSLPPRVYRHLRRASPILTFACMAASSWLFVRVVLLVDDVGGAQTFGVDIPIMAGIVVGWMLVVVALFYPPPEVIARTHYTAGDGPLVILSLGDGMRKWNLISVPLSGVVIGLIIVAGFQASQFEADDRESPSDVGVVVVMAVAAFGVCLLAILWMLSRSILQGAELFGSELIVHGFFRTRRYQRESIDHAEARNLRFFEEVFFISMMLYFNRTVRLTMRDGREHTLLASSGDNTDHGANVINAWLAGPHVESAPETGGR